MRPDGTPVYWHAARPGGPAVLVTRIDSEVAHAHRPPAHRHAHDFLALVYIERGAGTITLGGQDVPLRDGDVHAIPPGEAIGAATSADHEQLLAWSVTFTPDAVPALASVSPLAWTHHPLMALFGAGSGAGSGTGSGTGSSTGSGASRTGSANVQESDRPRWAARLAELEEELSEPGRLGARDAVSALLTRLLVGAARLAPSAPAPPDPLVKRVFDEIEETFRAPVSAADVARALGYTPGYLTTVVRRRTGRTLLDWIIERRMTEVRRLLRDTDLPLGVVAARTGLRDATYLVRRFKDRYGTTPERWRRAERV